MKGIEEMSNLLKIILIGSILLNLFAIWGLFHYIMYGGNPLSDLKRKLTGTHQQSQPKIPRAEENAKIRQEVSEGKTDSLRVVFFGASITNRWDLDKYFSEFHPINRGVGGFAPDLISKYKANVLDLKPRAVVMKICSINMRPTIPNYKLKDVVQMMVQLAQANDIIPIVATMIPSGRPAANIGEFSVVDGINDFNDWVREYTKTNQLAMIDYAAAIQDDNGFLPRDCSVDPVHVNDKGYNIMAKAALPVIIDVLGLD
ncbi:MAG: GDSL-type esterase/lipase family protein [candidate division Zixibacteria bacterium]|nr:GDSL-type esterase/lipase family protein [candidate division Zixibacteria bacterium]